MVAAGLEMRRGSQRPFCLRRARTAIVPVPVPEPAAHTAPLSRPVKRAFVCRQKRFSPHAGSFPRSSDHGALFVLVLTGARSLFSRAPPLPAGAARPGTARRGEMLPGPSRCPRSSGGAARAQGCHPRERQCSGQPGCPLRTGARWGGQCERCHWGCLGMEGLAGLCHPGVGLWG